jgi:hypothetical protein
VGVVWVVVRAGVAVGVGEALCVRVANTCTTGSNCAGVVTPCSSPETTASKRPTAHEQGSSDRHSHDEHIRHAMAIEDRRSLHH